MGHWWETDYCFQKVYLYAPGQPKVRSSVPFGTAEIEIVERKGVLICRVRDLPSVFTPRDKISLLICSRGGSQPLVIGQLHLDKSGIGQCRWDFNILGKKDKNAEGLADYQLLVKAQPAGDLGEDEGSRVLLTGIFSLAHEIRDTRVVGFKKEGKAQEESPESRDRNHLFTRVEPFDPPMPNVVWWQISIQPGVGYRAWDAGFCPRKKSKAVF